MTSLGKHLQVGQTVGLVELEFGYQLTILATGEPGKQVMEVGEDYVVLDDASAGVSTRLAATPQARAMAAWSTSPRWHAVV